MFAKAFVALVALAASVSANCVHNTGLSRRQAEAPVEVANFGYTGLQGPTNWAGLAPENVLCRTGTNQSPINIDATIQKLGEVPQVVIGNVASAEFENIGTTLEVIAGGNTTIGGTTFELKQFHMHSPSEHRIGEEYFPLEVHMVHEGPNGEIAVIALLFQLSEDGSTTDLLTNVIQNIDQVATPGTRTTTGPLDFAAVIQHVTTTPLFTYSGSLTTPPCAEGLTFVITEQPLPLNVQTYNAIKKVVKFNSRFTQNTLQEGNLLQVAADLAIREAGLDLGAGGGAAAVNVTGNEVNAVDVQAIIAALAQQNQNLEFNTVTTTKTVVTVAGGAVVGGAEQNNVEIPPVAGGAEAPVEIPGQPLEVAPVPQGQVHGAPVPAPEDKQEEAHRVKIERSRIGRRFMRRSQAAKRRL